VPEHARHPNSGTVLARDGAARQLVSAEVWRAALEILLEGETR